MELSDLQHLMHQLGPAMPEISVITQDDIDSWQVEFNGDASLQIEWQASPPCVLMTCVIGQPPEAAREAVYASLLNANRELTGLANMKLALSQPDNEVLLIGEYPLGAASVTALQASLSEFLQFAAEFSMMVADSPKKDFPPQAPYITTMHDQRA